MLSHDGTLSHRPRRILVAGVSGTGKTTLAARIAGITGGLPTEIDSLFHGPNWVPRPEFLDDVRALIATDSWTTEWQYGSARPLLAERADLLVSMKVMSRLYALVRNRPGLHIERVDHAFGQDQEIGGARESAGSAGLMRPASVGEWCGVELRSKVPIDSSMQVL